MRGEQKRGFTLIELLVVIVIIGILASIGVSTFNGYFAKARDAKRISQFKQTIDLIKLYVAENEALPTLTGTASPAACSGWRVANKDYTEEIIELGTVFGYKLEENYWEGCEGFIFYSYPPGAGGCPIENGRFLIFAMKLEEITSGDETLSSLGLLEYSNFVCSAHTWSTNHGSNLHFGIFENGHVGSP